MAGAAVAEGSGSVGAVVAVTGVVAGLGVPGATVASVAVVVGDGSGPLMAPGAADGRAGGVGVGEPEATGAADGGVDAAGGVAGVGGVAGWSVVTGPFTGARLAGGNALAGAVRAIAAVAETLHSTAMMVAAATEQSHD